MNWKQIRKDVGEITLGDLQQHPSWEFCLDEEGVEGQTECTMRPFKHSSASLSLGDYCMVGCKFTFPNKISHLGWIQLGGLEYGSEFESAENFKPEIFIDPTTPAEILEIEKFDLMTRCEGSIRMGFFLPPKRIVDDKSARSLIEKMASTIQIDVEDMFPIAMEPLQSILGWRHIEITEFHRMEP